MPNDFTLEELHEMKVDHTARMGNQEMANGRYHSSGQYGDDKKYLGRLDAAIADMTKVAA